MSTAEQPQMPPQMPDRQTSAPDAAPASLRRRVIAAAAGTGGAVLLIGVLGAARAFGLSGSEPSSPQPDAHPQPPTAEQFDPPTEQREPAQPPPEAPRNESFFESVGGPSCRSTVILTMGGDERYAEFNALPDTRKDGWDAVLVMEDADGDQSYVLSGGNSVRVAESDIAATNPDTVAIHHVQFLDGTDIRDVQYPLDEAVDSVLCGAWNVKSAAPLDLRDIAEIEPQPTASPEDSQPPSPEQAEWEGTIEMNCEVPRAKLVHDEETGDLFFEITPTGVVFDGKTLNEADEALRERTAQTTITSIAQVLDENGKIVAQYSKTGKTEYDSPTNNKAPTVEIPARMLDGNGVPNGPTENTLRIFIVEGNPRPNNEFEEQRKKDDPLGFAFCGTERYRPVASWPGGYGTNRNGSVFLNPATD